MEKFYVEKNITVFGERVLSFPSGISEAFDRLSKTITNPKTRSWYGISYFNKKRDIEYFALAEELTPGEAKGYQLDKFTIEQGEYLASKLADWRSKTDQVKNIFHELMQNEEADNTKPCIEWYYSDYEMFCMIKTKR